MQLRNLDLENERVEKAIRKYAKYYHAKEADCPSDFKFLMLINGWTSPFIAINELLKRVYSNEQIMKRDKIKYTQRYKDLQHFVQEIVNNETV